MATERRSKLSEWMIYSTLVAVSLPLRCYVQLSQVLPGPRHKVCTSPSVPFLQPPALLPCTLFALYLPV